MGVKKPSQYCTQLFLWYGQETKLTFLEVCFATLSVPLSSYGFYVTHGSFRQEAEFLDEIQTKVLRVFFLDIHNQQLPLQICL
jgi:hypothetical protein